MKNKAYKWNPEQEFKISGKEFANILHALKSILETPESKAIILAYEAAKNVETILEAGVKSGVVQEVE